MWYMASHMEEGAPGGFRYKVAYAVSQDGAHWTKPNLGQVDWEGSRDNNLIPRGVNWMRRANVIKDLRDPDPRRRFKMTYVDVFDGQPAITKGYSADGIHWRLNGDGKPWFRRPHNGNLLGWDPRIRRYVFYVRMRAAQNTVGRAVSADFVTWSEPETVMAPGPDEPDLHFKGLAAFLYEDLYLGWLWVFERGAKEFVAAAAELAVSRDGIHWSRPFPGSFVLERGEGPAWDSALSIPGGSRGARPADLVLLLGREHALHRGRHPEGQRRLVPGRPEDPEGHRPGHLAAGRIRLAVGAGGRIGHDTAFTHTRRATDGQRPGGEAISGRRSWTGTAM